MNSRLAQHLVQLASLLHSGAIDDDQLVDYVEWLVLKYRVAPSYVHRKITAMTRFMAQLDAHRGAGHHVRAYHHHSTRSQDAHA